MLTEIDIENFRSIEKATVELRPLTILFGPTASGKSSLMYALLVLRNFILNSNQTADGFFNLHFMSLGGFDDCVFGHDKSRTVRLAATASYADGSSRYELGLSKSSATVQLEVGEASLRALVDIPYPINQTFTETFIDNQQRFVINWNAIACTVSPDSPTAESQAMAGQLASRFNRITEQIKAIDIAPHRRGFYKASYTPSSVTHTPVSEDEVATLIINDPHMAPKISEYAEAILRRDFRLYIPPGTATVFFQSTDKDARVPGLLVNDGFGVNQIIYLLAKMLRPEVRTLLIEEPEVHLHPSVLRKFAREVCTLVKKERKQIVLTTHSEQFVSSVLTAVSEGHFGPEGLKCYLVTKEDRQTFFEAQNVNEKGQIDGGLASFVEAELEDLKRMIGIGN